MALKLFDKSVWFWRRIDGPIDVKFRTADGCNRCNGTGYLERVGVYEVLAVDEVISERLVYDRPSSEAMRALAIEHGLAHQLQRGLGLRANLITKSEESAKGLAMIIQLVSSIRADHSLELSCRSQLRVHASYLSPNMVLVLNG